MIPGRSRRQKLFLKYIPDTFSTADKNRSVESLESTSILIDKIKSTAQRPAGGSRRRVAARPAGTGICVACALKCNAHCWKTILKI